MSKDKILVFILLSLFPVRAYCDFRCPESGKIVSEGMTQYEVKARCGEPSNKTELKGTDLVVSRNKIGNSSDVTIVQPSAPVEEWTYDFGSNQLTRTLRFENGKLEKVTTGGYGLNKNK